MIPLEKFVDLAHRMMRGAAAEGLRAMMEGRHPIDGVEHGLAATYRQLWLMMQPNTDVMGIDLMPLMEGIGRKDDFESLKVIVVHTVEPMEMQSVFVEGSGPGGPPDNAQRLAINDILFGELVRQGFEPADIKGLLLDGGLEETFNKTSSAHIDAEVEKFREEIDSRIDSIFKRGGDE